MSFTFVLKKGCQNFALNQECADVKIMRTIPRIYNLWISESDMGDIQQISDKWKVQIRHA